MLTTLDINRDTYIFICCNIRTRRKSCGCFDADEIFDYFRSALNFKRTQFNSGRIVKINKTGCLNHCANGPNLVIYPDNFWYTYRSLADIDEIIDSHIIKGIPVKRLQQFHNPLKGTALCQNQKVS